MDKLQYERWKDFSLRMAKTCFYGHRRPTSTWILEQVESWFYWRDFQEDWENYNSWDQDSYPLCDHISEFYDDETPRLRCKECKKNRWYRDHDNCKCYEIEERAYYQFDEQWLGPIRCCLRAGIDFACQPSAGVVGFTAGDLRRMYPEGVPEWVMPKGERLYYWLTDELNGTFEDLPDSAGIVF